MQMTQRALPMSDSFATSELAARHPNGSTRLAGINLNLLVALDALLREGNVTRAAARIGISQPAMSHSLARLRDHFGDPLLLTNGRLKGFTPKAQQMRLSVFRAADALADLFDERRHDDPQTSRRRFVTALPAHLALRVVPQLVETLARQRPHLGLEVRPLHSPIEQVLHHAADLALGAFVALPQGIECEHLFAEPFVCVVRADHPCVDYVLPVASYLELSHVEVTSPPALSHGVDRFLEIVGARRRVSATVDHILLAAPVLMQSDLVLTTTRAFARTLLEMAPLRVVELPPDVPGLRFSQIWRSADERNEDHICLRRAARDVCLAVTSDRAKPRGVKATALHAVEAGRAFDGSGGR
jgi:DNA-binding transcriptional LysR family regulator